MKPIFASAEFGMIGLLIFFTLFIVMLIWLFKPGAKSEFKEHGNIPLKDDNDE